MMRMSLTTRIQLDTQSAIGELLDQGKIQAHRGHQSLLVMQPSVKKGSEDSTLPQWGPMGDSHSSR